MQAAKTGDLAAKTQGPFVQLWLTVAACRQTFFQMLLLALHLKHAALVRTCLPDPMLTEAC